ncbi:MAG: glucose-1-phosphate cytidylyltransferase [Candidatus Marinamargulisbacteria bacterium]|jgi:glucose-1-phosphate cytidylyltransferase
MKVVILAGGFGTRLGSDTELMPKPMVEIGNRPILWHIMKQYSACGFDEFVILLGYKGGKIKEFFSNYLLYQSNVTFDFATNDVKVHSHRAEPWTVTLLDTGVGTLTGSRIKKVKSFIGDEPFLLTYGDGVANVDMKELVKFHKENGKTVTVTAVQPEGRFGSLVIEDKQVVDFIEKPKGDDAWINGGFFVCNPAVFDYIGDGDDISFEQDPLQKLASSGELCVRKHHGYWQCMDTPRDKAKLNEAWTSGNAPWKQWV